MSLLTNTTPLGLWQDVITSAKLRCEINLHQELETYLINLLVQYTDKPDIPQQIMATAFLEAMQLKNNARNVGLQQVGDQCLIYAGLFPHLAEKRNVKLSYFVDMGRAAYSAVSKHDNDLFGHLALQFVLLMDVLQSIRPQAQMSPLEAYTQWSELGSQYAFMILKQYSKAIPIK